MILESQIGDDRVLTLDCAKATLRKGSRVEIPDDCFGKAEVQNAIRMGLIRLIGTPPAGVSLFDEPKHRFRNAHGTRLTFECIKGTVDPGKTLAIPESKVNEREVQNAIAWGYLLDLDGGLAGTPVGNQPPVVIDEVRITEGTKDSPSVKSVQVQRPNALEDRFLMIDAPVKKEVPAAQEAETVPIRRPVKTSGKMKAKPITSRHEVSDSSDDLFRPTQVRDVQEEPPPAPVPVPRPTPKPMPAAKAEPEKKPSFLDMFEEEPITETKVVDPAPQAPAEEDDFLS